MKDLESKDQNPLQHCQKTSQLHRDSLESLMYMYCTDDPSCFLLLLCRSIFIYTIACLGLQHNQSSNSLHLKVSRESEQYLSPPSGMISLKQISTVVSTYLPACHIELLGSLQRQQIDRSTNIRPDIAYDIIWAGSYCYFYVPYSRRPVCVYLSVAGNICFKQKQSLQLTLDPTQPSDGRILCQKQKQLQFK